ncbi:MAG: hypothetical protein M1376_00755 [Planctomycetes bacterium]|nr:hypothetical protein [Planctomycetota bacterium]
MRLTEDSFQPSGPAAEALRRPKATYFIMSRQRNQRRIARPQPTSRPTTLHDRETKQVEFLRADGAQTQRLYVYDGAKIDQNRYRNWSYDNIRQDRDYGTQSNPKVWVMKEFQNTKANHLGMPLPRGRVRFYQRDDDGKLEFIGENTIDHTPRDETVRVYTGDAFDLVGERRRTDYQIDAMRLWLDESFEIKVRNRKESGGAETYVSPVRDGAFMISEAAGGAVSQARITDATSGMLIESCSLVLGKEW